MSVSVHSQTRQILDEKAASGAPPLWEMTPDEAGVLDDADKAVADAGAAIRAAVKG